MSDFDEFWKAYPRRVEKITARTAYDKALKVATATQILQGAMRYAAERQGQNPRFTKHPASWLNAGCWDDEPIGKTNGQSVLAAFDRLEQRFAGADDRETREDDFLGLPPR